MTKKFSEPVFPASPKTLIIWQSRSGFNSREVHWLKHVWDSELVKDALTRFHVVSRIREDSPDFDDAIQMLHQSQGLSGGWPAQVITLPNGLPLMGFGAVTQASDCAKLLNEVAEAWILEPDLCMERAVELRNTMLQESPLAPVASDSSYVDAWRIPCFQSLDLEAGLWGKSEYFHYPYVYMSLLQSSQAEDRELGVRLVERLILSPLFDPISGGFFRWMRKANSPFEAPEIHSEKLLAENVAILEAMRVAYGQSHSDSIGLAMSQTVKWVLRELSESHIPGSDFFKSPNASIGLSAGIGAEADFYQLSNSDLFEALSGSERAVIQKFFHIGSHPRFPLIGAQAISIVDIAKELKMDRADAMLTLARATSDLERYRRERMGPRPIRLKRSRFAEALWVSFCFDVAQQFENWKGPKDFSSRSHWDQLAEQAFRLMLGWSDIRNDAPVIGRSRQALLKAYLSFERYNHAASSKHEQFHHSFANEIERDLVYSESDAILGFPFLPRLMDARDFMGPSGLRLGLFNLKAAADLAASRGQNDHEQSLRSRAIQLFEQSRGVRLKLGLHAAYPDTFLKV